MPGTLHTLRIMTCFSCYYTPFWGFLPTVSAPTLLFRRLACSGSENPPARPILFLQHRTPRGVGWVPSVPPGLPTLPAVTGLSPTCLGLPAHRTCDHCSPRRPAGSWKRSHLTRGGGGYATPPGPRASVWVGAARGLLVTVEMFCIGGTGGRGH